MALIKTGSQKIIVIESRMRPTILIFGKNGQLGKTIVSNLKEGFNVIKLTHISKIFCGDFKNNKGIENTINKISPDIIINASAYTNVDQAENQKKEAKQINSSILKVIAGAAKKNNSLLIHFSSDYVYSGNGNRPWKERDIKEPVNYYGKTKLSGDKLIQLSKCNYIIFRTAWVYSLEKNNFLKTMIKLMKSKKKISVINDQIGSPTSTTTLSMYTSYAINDYLKNRLSSKLINKTYNLTTDGFTSWYGFAVEIRKFLIKHGIKVTIKKINPIPSNEYRQKAKRPLNSRLNKSKINKLFNLNLPKWQTDLGNTIKKINET